MTFIAFEGLDGAGKTTLVRKVASLLREVNLPVVHTKEPTDGEYGAGVRNPRLPRYAREQAAWADRGEHVHRVLRPALERGDIILCDRYYLSTAAYQGSDQANAAWLLKEHAKTFPRPNLWVYVATPLGVCHQRILDRSKDDSPKARDLLKVLARYEYLLANERVGRVLIVPGTSDSHDTSVFLAHIIRSIHLPRVQPTRATQETNQCS